MDDPVDFPFTDNIDPMLLVSEAILNESKSIWLQPNT